ncbi:MAG: hypothetical protein KDC71_03765 [Acidobacteria bacterium]|nr:hypothetical protein [Acidobacteriota bacterium]
MSLLFLLFFWGQSPVQEAEPQLPLKIEQYLVAVRDSKTGQLRQPTPDEYQALSDHFAKSQEQLPIEEFMRQDGTVGQRLNGHYMNFSFVVVKPNGERFFACLKNPDALEQMETKAANHDQ